MNTNCYCEGHNGKMNLLEFINELKKTIRDLEYQTNYEPENYDVVGVQTEFKDGFLSDVTNGFWYEPTYELNVLFERGEEEC